MNQEMLKQFNYYVEHQAEFIEKYNGKAIVLKDFEVVGVQDNEWEAFDSASKKYEPETFIVQQVSPGPGAYTVVISSNFVYAG